MRCLVFTDTGLYGLTKGTAYLANQRRRRSTCLRDQCYDVGCYPWHLLFAKHGISVNPDKKKKERKKQGFSVAF